MELSCNYSHGTRKVDSATKDEILSVAAVWKPHMRQWLS